MDITGFDAETCCKIQPPVMNVFMMSELMVIGSEIANQHLSIITHNIRQHLLSIQPSLEIGVTTELPYTPKTESRKIAKVSSETDFSATCHGSIAVDSLMQHAVDENGKGKGADAIASIQRFNLSHNRLNDADATNLNNGLLGYTISAQTFNLSNNVFGPLGIDSLIKGPKGIEYFGSGGADLSHTFQGLFTHYNVNIVHLNLSNNNIGDVGANIIGHAFVAEYSPTPDISMFQGMGSLK